MRIALNSAARGCRKLPRFDCGKKLQNSLPNLYTMRWYVRRYTIHGEGEGAPPHPAESPCRLPRALGSPRAHPTWILCSQLPPPRFHCLVPRMSSGEQVDRVASSSWLLLCWIRATPWPRTTSPSQMCDESALFRSVDERKRKNLQLNVPVHIAHVEHAAC